MNTFLIILAVLVVLVLVLNFAMGKEMSVDRKIIINLPPDQVFAYLRITRNQDAFSKWNMSDPNKKVEGIGTDGQVGFIYRWDSQLKQAGAGEQEIIALEEGKSITYALRFKRPMENNANGQFLVSPAGAGQTEVTWRFYGPTKFPMRLFSPLIMNMLGKDMEQSLGNLKNILKG